MANQLEHTQIKTFHSALLSAYDEDSLDMMLTFELGKNLNELTGGGRFTTVVLDVIRSANQEGWVMDLVQKSHEYVPGNGLLKSFAESVTKPAPSSTAPPVSDKGSGGRQTGSSEPMNGVTLRNKMTGKHGVSMSELKIIINDLSVSLEDSDLDFDNFEGGRELRVLGLIQYLQRRNKLSDLVAYLEDNYPHVLGGE